MEDKLVAGAEPTWFFGVDGDRFSRGDDWCGQGCGLDAGLSCNAGLVETVLHHSRGGRG